MNFHQCFPLLSAAALLLAGFPALHAAEHPNILLIVADDHGYADVGFQGCKDIPTPHLDRLAREGLHCTSGYVSHPFCSPTRAGLMTGRYQQRFGHQNNPFYNPNDHKEGLPMSEKLLPAFLGQAGYVTGWIGKWHLGAAPEFHPEKRGFAETFGFIGGGHRYIDWKAVRNGPGKTLELYDLKTDPGETKDLAIARPDLVAQAEALIKQARVDDPNWPIKPAGKGPLDRTKP